MKKMLTTLAVASVVLIFGCNKSNLERFGTPSNEMSDQTMVQAVVPFVGLSNFAVLAGETVTNDGASLITGDMGVSPGSAITGFDLAANTIMGPGTVTGGPGIVDGTIYAGGPVAAQAHNEAVIAYDYLMAQVPTTTYPDGEIELDGLILKPGIYSFKPSANLLLDGTLTLDFQGNPDALFIFQMESTLVMKAGSKVIALNNNNATCNGSNVYWAVGSSATIDGAEFIGNVIAYTTITMNRIGANVSGRIWALNGEVTMISDIVSVCGGSGGGPLPEPCRDFVTGGGWINDKATFGVSGGIRYNEYWGQLSFNDHSKKNDHGNESMNVKSTSVTAYIVIDAVTRQIEGTASVNGKGSFTYKVVVVDNGEPGRNDSFSLELSNGYSASGTLKGGNIQLHTKCGGPPDKDHKEHYFDKDEKDGHRNCDNDNNDNNDNNHGWN